MNDSEEDWEYQVQTAYAHTVYKEHFHSLTVTRNKSQTYKHTHINTQLHAHIYTVCTLAGPDPAVCEYAGPLICGLVGASSKVPGLKKA